MKIAGILLIVVAVVALAYGEFSYTSRKKLVDMGPIQIDRTEQHTFLLPPLLGIAAVVGGGALIFLRK